MTENLNQLRQVAKRATPGPWMEFHENGTPGEYEAFICPPATGARLVDYAPQDQRDKDALHIATFDPTTVLALIERIERAEQAVQRVRELCVDTDGNPIDPDFDGNTVGDIRRALDGGEYETRVVDIEILPEVSRIPALLDEANRELARSSQFRQRDLRNLGLDLIGSVSDEGESFLRRHDNSGVRQIVEKHFQEDR